MQEVLLPPVSTEELQQVAGFLCWCVSMSHADCYGIRLTSRVLLASTLYKKHSLQNLARHYASRKRETTKDTDTGAGFVASGLTAKHPTHCTFS